MVLPVVLVVPVVLDDDSSEEDASFDAAAGLECPRCEPPWEPLVCRSA